MNEVERARELAAEAAERNGFPAEVVEAIRKEGRAEVMAAGPGWPAVHVTVGDAPADPVMANVVARLEAIERELAAGHLPPAVVEHLRHHGVTSARSPVDNLGLYELTSNWISGELGRVELRIVNRSTSEVVWRLELGPRPR